MEMILEKKHGTTNYGSKESGNQIGDDLLRMTPEETVYRSYYRMEQGLDKFSAEEESQIRIRTGYSEPLLPPRRLSLTASTTRP